MNQYIFETQKEYKELRRLRMIGDWPVYYATISIMTKVAA